MKNSINWFEIPVVDLARATSFYGKLLELPLKAEDFNGTPMTVMKSEGVSGALMQFKDRKPSSEGAVVYLNVDGRLDQVLARVKAVGGELVQPRTDLGPQGAYAVFRDSEGNHVGVHQSA